MSVCVCLAGCLSVYVHPIDPEVVLVLCACVYVCVHPPWRRADRSTRLVHVRAFMYACNPQILGSGKHQDVTGVCACVDVCV